jgi:hypothetical protein
MNRLVRTVSLCALAVCLALLMPAAVRAADVPDVPDSHNVSQLLADAKAQAYQLKEDAWLLESYTRGPITRESHAVVLNSVKDHANSLFRVLTKLEDARPGAAPWQRTAIDRISPLLKELCSNTTATINYLNKNAAKIGTPE